MKTNLSKLHLFLLSLAAAQVVMSAPMSVNPQATALAKLAQRSYELYCDGDEKYCNTLPISTRCEGSMLVTNDDFCRKACSCRRVGGDCNPRCTKVAVVDEGSQVDASFIASASESI